MVTPLVFEERYISPWVLPDETFTGRLVWKATEELHEISILLPEQAEIGFTDVLDFKRNGSKITVLREDLETQCSLTLRGKVKETPKKEETFLTVTLTFWNKEKELLAEELLETLLIRPFFRIEEVSPEKVTLDRDSVDVKIQIRTRAYGWADVLRVKPSIEVDSSFLEAVYFTPVMVDETDPFLSFRVERYLQKIRIKRVGKTEVTLSFTYQDRVGNSYTSNTVKIGVAIGQIVEKLREIPVINVISTHEGEKVVPVLGEIQEEVLER